MSDDDKKPVEKDSSDAGKKEQDVEKKPDEASGREGEGDWKELLRLEREGRLKAERDRDNYREGLLNEKRRNRSSEDDIDPEDDEQPLKRKDLRDVIEPIIGQTRVDSILASVVTDPTKRAYVKDLYEHRIQRTGTSEETIRADLETALDLADSKKLRKENSEIKRMNENNRTYIPPNGGGGGGGGGGTRTTKAHEWTPQQEEVLERRAQSIGLQGEAVEKYKEKAWQETLAGTAFAVKPKPRN